jgi:hypothetical protein
MRDDVAKKARNFISPLAQTIDSARLAGKKRIKIAGNWVKIGKYYAAFDSANPVVEPKTEGKPVRRGKRS